MTYSLPSPRLMDLFHFTSDDLAANRAGQISARQQARIDDIAAQENRDIGCALFVFGVGGVAAVIFCGALFNLPAIFSVLAPFVIPMVLAVIGVVLLVIYANWRGGRERMGAHRGAGTATAAGEIRLRLDEIRTKPVYVVTVGEREFRVTYSVFEGLRDYEHLPYQVYYLPRSGQILSLEPLI